METLTKYFNRLAQPVMGKHGFAQVDMLSQWDAIVGPDISAACVPSQIKKPRDGGAGTLVVKAWAGMALDVQYQVPQIIERVNRYFGYLAISAVKITQNGAARPLPAAKITLDAAPIAARLSGFEDEALKAALARLGAGVAARSPLNPQAK
jgi:hypothetical protein